MKYARIVENTVDDIFVPQAGFTIEESLHEAVRVLYEQVPEEVQVGWKKHQDGSFSAPPPEVIPVAEV